MKNPLPYKDGDGFEIYVETNVSFHCAVCDQYHENKKFISIKMSSIYGDEVLQFYCVPCADKLFAYIKLNMDPNLRAFQ